MIEAEFIAALRRLPLHAGAQGLAVVSALCAAPDPEAEARRICTAMGSTIGTAAARRTSDR